jgi:hypothetical protein
LIPILNMGRQQMAAAISGAYAAVHVEGLRDQFMPPDLPLGGLVRHCL